MNPPVLGHPNYQISLFLFASEKEGNTLEVLTQKYGTTIDPQGIDIQQADPVAW